MSRFLNTLILLSSMFLSLAAASQSRVEVKTYRAYLLRADSARIVFQFEERMADGKPVWYFLNAGERLEAKNIRQRGDSVFVDMPFFESAFEGKRQKDGTITGLWRKGTPGAEVKVPFLADPNLKGRFPEVKGPAKYNVQGRWRGVIISADGSKEEAVVDLRQQGNRLTGTFIFNSGDYRYLEGVVTGDSLVMSTFDGSHAYVFAARIGDANTIQDGVFHAGATARRSWSAVRDDRASVDLEETAAHLRTGQSRLDFRFPDLDSNLVSINDERFRNKVVVIQIMGSWCPNCMDETAFLTQYYKANRQRGVEMIALAYEYSTDFQRSVRSLRKFQERYALEYPILITGVKVGDSLRTEKTLPQITEIKTFPTTIFIGRDGTVKKVANDFFGPATGEYYERYKRDFGKTMNELL
jgi:peroxiredoxin